MVINSLGSKCDILTQAINHCSTHFHRKTQGSNETIADFTADHHTLAGDCAFGTYLPVALRDQFVFGLQNEAVHRRLLAEDTVTLKQAFEVSTGMNTASKDANTLQKSCGSSATNGSSQASSLQALWSEQSCSMCSATIVGSQDTSHQYIMHPKIRGTKNQEKSTYLLLTRLGRKIGWQLAISG